MTSYYPKVTNLVILGRPAPIGTWGVSCPSLEGAVKIGGRGKADLMGNRFDALFTNRKVANGNVAAQIILDGLKRCPIRLQFADQGA